MTRLRSVADAPDTSITLMLMALCAYAERDIIFSSPITRALGGRALICYARAATPARRSCVMRERERAAHEFAIIAMRACCSDGAAGHADTPFVFIRQIFSLEGAPDACDALAA